MVFICCIVLLQIVESDEVRISKKKTVLFVIMFLCLSVSFWESSTLKSVADYRQAVRETTFEDINISDILTEFMLVNMTWILYMPKWKLPCKMEKSQILTFWSTGMNVERPQKLSLTV